MDNFRHCHAVEHRPLTAAFLRHRSELLQHLVRQVDCHETAANLLQDTFVRIARQEADGDIVNPYAFLYRVAGNLALDQRRAAARRAQWDGGGPVEEWACPRPQPDAVLSGQQARGRFEASVAQLPLPQRHLLLKCLIDGKTCRQAAVEERLQPKQVDRVVRQVVRSLRDEH